MIEEVRRAPNQEVGVALGPQSSLGLVDTTYQDSRGAEGVGCIGNCGYKQKTKVASAGAARLETEWARGAKP